MAPELPREQDTRRRAPPKRRLSAHDQEPDGISNKRARVEDDSSQSQYTSSTYSASSTHPSHARRATTTAPSEENLAGTWQFPASNTPTLTVVERAAILSARLPFSTHRQFSILDTSFGATCQTNFCAQIEGFEGMWVAKLSYRDLFDELVRHVLGEDNTRRLCLIAVGEEPSQVMGGAPGWFSAPRPL
ncbi:hypothetical protein CDV31_007244 [Fusarium ambrosium]|uniref:Uncharacterized protein n=1 Tax=Fusarium ambrosium TaxID=131363 RepID=A0A428U822_9HYPO|nr:hypothetical protein CDV31_007244 [Fusarium ambrosium]